MNLVIVESPSKCRKIEGFLGSDFRVVASMGHFRDLPAKGFGMDLETMEPTYTITKPEVSERLAPLIERAEKVYLCTDPDREGEAIAWHLTHLLPDDKPRLRATFQEITQKAVRQAIDNPGELRMPMVDAQQARRIIDKLVGFEICGRDGVFHPAQGVIKGRSVEIFSKAVRKPAAIRYGWSSIVKGNLFSKNGLPATPFRTDKIPAPNFEGELESKEVTISSIIGKPMEALMKVNTYTLEKVNVADVEAFKPVLPEGKKNYLAFFKNNISEIKDGKKPKLKVMVVFYDNGTGIIDITYDSSDKKVFNTNSKPGTYKLAAKVKLTGTNTLRYVEVDVPDALFSNRLYGVADIRLQSKTPFIIRGIFIQPL